MKYFELKSDELFHIYGGGIFTKIGAWCKKVYCNFKNAKVYDDGFFPGGPSNNYVS